MRTILFAALSLFAAVASAAGGPLNTQTAPVIPIGYLCDGSNTNLGYCIKVNTDGSINANTSGGGGAGTTVLNPSSTSAAGITPQEANAASSLVAKSSAGNWYSASVSVGATAVYLMAFNATSAPADGAVTPAWCAGPFPASNPTSVSWGPASPAYFSTGITLVTSSTGCTTKTATAVTTLTAQVQ